MNHQETLLITVWDGTLNGCGDVHGFCESLTNTDRMAGFDRLVLLGPGCVDAAPLQQIVKHYQERLKLSFEMLPYAFTDDRYWGKSIIGDYILSRDVADLDRICYLDADHIFFGSLNLPETNQSSVWLSSEQMAPQPLPESDATRQAGVIPKDHFNTSLILGNKETLKPIFERWAESYQRLSLLVTQRYLEEIAFSHAAKSVGIPLSRVTESLQGSWASLPVYGSVFHYGGECEAARYAKAESRRHNTIEEVVSLSNQLQDAILHAAQEQ